LWSICFCFLVGVVHEGWWGRRTEFILYSMRRSVGGHGGVRGQSGAGSRQFFGSHRCVRYAANDCCRKVYLERDEWIARDSREVDRVAQGRDDTRVYAGAPIAGHDAAACCVLASGGWALALAPRHFFRPEWWVRGWNEAFYISLYMRGWTSAGRAWSPRQGSNFRGAASTRCMGFYLDSENVAAGSSLSQGPWSAHALISLWLPSGGGGAVRFWSKA